jgi:hypothetical protein
MILRIILFISIICPLARANAQSGNVVTGGQATGAGSVSYTVGQISIMPESGSGKSVSPGIQQPYEISILTGLEYNGIEIESSVYPNPAQDYLLLSVIGLVSGGMKYVLSDMSGRTISEEQLRFEQTEISLTGLSNGNYFLRIYNENAALKTFSIIRNR